MAISHLFNQSSRATLLDAWGYGDTPQPATQMGNWLVGSAIVFYFGLLPLLWRHAVWLFPSIVWTSLATCLIWAALIAARKSSISLKYVTLCTALFCASYPLFGWISYEMLDQISSERRDLLYETILIMQLGLALYFLGAAARSHRAYLAIWGAWGVTATYALLNAQNMNIQALYEATLETGIILNYQLMGDAFAICSAIIAPRIKQTHRQWLFAAVAVGIMFVIPSRSAAFFGVCALFCSLVLFGTRNSRILLISVAIVLALGQQSGFFASLFEGTRFESAFTPDSDDHSWDSRQEAMDHGLAAMMDRPFTGEWAFQLTDLKFSGHYIHNALDIWAQTGIVPFLLFLALWATLIANWWNAWSRRPRMANEAAPVLLFVGMSWILSRNVTNAALFFCLGYASATLAQALHAHWQRR